MKPARGSGHLQRWEKAEDTDSIWIVKPLRPQLYLELSCHFRHSAYCIVVVMLGPVQKSETAIVRGTVVVCVNRLHQGYGVPWQMSTSVVASVDWIGTAGAAPLVRFVRPGIGCQIKSFRYRLSVAVTAKRTASMTMSSMGIFVWLEVRSSLRQSCRRDGERSMRCSDPAPIVDACSMYREPYQSTAPSTIFHIFPTIRKMNLMIESTDLTIVSTTLLKWKRLQLGLSHWKGATKPDSLALHLFKRMEEGRLGVTFQVEITCWYKVFESGLCSPKDFLL